MNMNVIVSEDQMKNFLRRRFTPEELLWIVGEVKEMINHGVNVEDALYDGIREFIKSKNFSDIDEFGDDLSYWDSYLRYERPLVGYVKMKLGL